jgi:5'-3' exonuclease
VVTTCFDVNNLAVRNLFGADVIQYVNGDKTKVASVNYDLMKFRIFDSIYRSLYRVSGVREVVLAMDDRRSWRKLYWTKYKAQRKDKRERLDLDWDEYYEHYESFMQDIKEHFPYKIVKVKDGEADDVIGTLVTSKPQEFYIISTDKDFLQLSSPRVKIYNPLKKVLVEHPNPELFLVQECMCGQAKDNIYNVKTPLDFPEDKRKPPFGEKTFEKIIASAGGYKQWLEENNLKERYEFNRNLMDFERIPAEIKRRVLRDYDDYQKPDLDKIYEFFKKYPYPDFTDNFTNVENKIMELY